jgi:hypothetical protein
MANFDDLLNNAPKEERAEYSPEYSKEEYAERKKAEREALYELSDNTALEVAADGGKFRQYLDVQAWFDRYSAVNALLITAQNPEATKIGDFDHWKQKGGFVRQGQSGISILEPGKEYEREDGSVGVLYNAKKVFDISQVDTRKMKKTPAVNHDERRILKALIAKAPVRITGVDELPDGGAGARTDPDTGEIHVLKGMGFADTFRAVARELAFTAGPDAQADPSFSAYCVSYLLCKKYGVDTKGYDFSGAEHALRDMDAQEIKSELSKIRDAAEEIGGRMARELEAASKADTRREPGAAERSLRRRDEAR